MADRIADLANGWPPDGAHVPEALREAEVTRLRLLGDSSNYVFLADLDHPAHGAGLGVYKPQRGERPLADFPYGTLPRREVAAYELARLLGWPIVPPTVEREGPEGPGSMQLFVAHDPAEHFFALRERDELCEQLMRFAAFDLVANNADRKGGHLLLGDGGRLWGIDQALCFHAHEKLRTVIWDFAGEELPDGWRSDLARARDALRRAAEEGDGAEADGEGGEAAAALRALLGGAEIEALAERLERLLAHPVLPEMYPWRCVPWPMI